MTLTEASKSGKPFKRAHNPAVFWRVKREQTVCGETFQAFEFLFLQPEHIHLKEISSHFSPEDIEADDWEVKED